MAPQSAFSMSGLQRGLLVGSACSGWSTESQALSNLQTPHQVKFLCDSDPHVQAFLRANLPFTRYHENVFDAGFVNEERVQIFMAGPPCQPFSPEGQRGGSSDCRANTVTPIKDYISRARPDCWVLENVPPWQSSTVFQETMEELRSLKTAAGDQYYNMYSQVLSTHQFGAPQRRSRLYCVGIEARYDQGFVFPQPFAAPPVFESILDPGEVMPPIISDVSQLNPQALANKTCQENVFHVLQQFHKKQQDPFASHVLVDLGTGRGNRFTEAMFPTLTATRCKQRGYFNLRLNRRHTISELIRAQGAYPEGMDISCIPESAVGHMCGNAMSVNVVTHLLGAVLLSRPDFLDI